MSGQWLGILVLVSLLGACTTVPTGPGVMVLPGSGKSLDQFHADDAACRQWGFQAIGMTPEQAATGAGAARYTGQEGQWRYDMAYMQCMYARGNQIPGYQGGYRSLPAPPPSTTGGSAPSTSGSIPPPPPGSPPPPPPNAPR
jgi:hypothetical protein